MATDLSSPMSRRHAITARAKNLVRGIYPKSFSLGLGVVLMVGGSSLYFRSGTATSQAQASAATVQRKTIVSSVKATGKVTFANEQQLKFNQRGTVAKVNFREGAHVKQGQLIAELDTSAVRADIRQAQLSVNAGTLQLQQLQNDKQKTIDDAKNSLMVSEQKLPSDLAAADRSVTEKRSALEQAKLELEKTRTTEIQGIATTSQNLLTKSETILDALYGVLTLDSASRPAQGNYTLEIDHQIYNDHDVRQRVENDYYDSLHAVEQLRTGYGSGSAPDDPAALVRTLASAKAVATSIHTLTEDIYVLLRGATTDMNRFTVDDLNAARSTVSANRATAADLVDQADTAQANLAAASPDAEGAGSLADVPSVTLRQKQDAVANAEHSLTLAQENLKVLQTQTPGDLQSKRQALDSTVASTDINIQLKQNDVSQKQTSVQKAAKILADYQLKAPFDGIITHIDYKVGDNLLDTGDTEYAVLQNPDFIVVTVPLDQVDVVRVRKAMAANIVFDALPGQTFPGVIDQIDPTPVEQSGVVSYNVLIRLPTPKGLTILSGMTATVQIETARKENILAVPNLALKNVAGESSVQRADGQSATVTTGATDGQFTEILSGLDEGDSILSMNIPTATTGTNANAAQQLLRGAGGFGAGGGGGFGGGPTGTVRVNNR